MNPLITLVATVAVVIVWYRCHVRLRAKAYGRLAISGAFVASFLLCLGAVSSVLGPQASQDAADDRAFPIAALLWILLILGLSRIAIAYRSRRMSGRRRSLVPYGLFGRLLLVSAGGLFLFFVWQIISPTTVPRGEALRALGGLLVLVTLGQYCLTLARRLKTAPVVLPSSKESVLYLRAFDDERRPFAVGPRRTLRHYTNQFTAQATNPRNPNPTIKLTLDDFLKAAITARMGPFVGLGNPADRLPPDGAVREYAPDAAWKQRFLDLARSAKCIVIALGESDNLQWELNEIKEQGMCQKVCMFTPPRRDFGNISKALSTESARRTDLESMWAASSKALQRAGYDSGTDCPGSGAAITFDKNGKSILLTTDASTPDDFIAPAADWFDSHTKTGKWVPGSCCSCHTTIYYTSTGSSAGGICYSCRVQAKLKDMSPLHRLIERHPVILSIWIVLSMLIAAWLSMSLSLGSWLSIVLWVVVLLTPWGADTGFGWARRVWSRRASTAPPSAMTTVHEPPAPSVEDKPS
jgi:hypothetical protein